MNTHKMIKILAPPALLFALALASTLAYAESVGQYVDDAAITTKVRGVILADPQLKPMQIDVHTDKGTVQLTGTVNSPDADAEAVKDAHNIDGVRAVMDRLTVRKSQEQ